MGVTLCVQLSKVKRTCCCGGGGGGDGHVDAVNGL